MRRRLLLSFVVLRAAVTCVAQGEKPLLLRSLVSAGDSGGMRRSEPLLSPSIPTPYGKS